MGYEENRKAVQKPHNIIMEDRKKLSISGVEEVESFDDTQIIMRTVSGNLVVRGSELQLERLNLDSGDVGITGLVRALDYEEVAVSGSLWTKLFH